MLVIAGQVGFGLSCTSGLMIVPFVVRSVSSILGYFNSGDTPMLRLSRLNVVSLLALLATMSSLLFGSEILTMSLFMLMLFNLFDVYAALTYDRPTT